MRLAVLIALWVLAAPAMADVARPATEADTLVLMRDTLISLDAVETAEIDTEDRSVKASGPDGLEFVSYPDNLHRNLQLAETDAERQEILDQFVSGLVETFAATALDEPKDREAILPMIRPVDFATGLEGGAAPLSAPFAGDLRIFYAFNNPKTLSYVTPEDAQALGLDAAALAALAAENFARQGWQPEVAGDGIFFLDFDGTFEASFLLDRKLWETVDEQLGQIVMAPVARDLILFTDAEWDGAEAALRKSAAELATQVSYPLSTLIYEWRDGVWQVRG